MKLPDSVSIGFSKKVLPWVETFWHNKKRYPRDEELLQEFKNLTPDHFLLMEHSKFWETCLTSRGIKRNPNAPLSPTQVAAITVVTNFTDTRSTEVKLLSVGVTAEQMNGWYADPKFQTELASRADSIMDNIFPEAQAQLARQIKRGNFPALKFYYELTGRASSPEAVNIKLAMSRLIEAVQKHVKDPATLEAIAHELNGPQTKELEGPN